MSRIHKIVFELYTDDGEPLTSMNGYCYVPPVNTQVVFSDTFEDSKGETISIELVSTAESYSYLIEDDTLVVNCVLDEPYEKVHENIKENIKKYNKSKI